MEKKAATIFATNRPTTSASGTRPSSSSGNRPSSSAGLPTTSNNRPTTATRSASICRPQSSAGRSSSPTSPNNPSSPRVGAMSPRGRMMASASVVDDPRQNYSLGPKERRVTRIEFELVGQDDPRKRNIPMRSFEGIVDRIQANNETTELEICGHYCLATLQPIPKLLERFPSIRSIAFVNCTFPNTGPHGVEALSSLIVPPSSLEELIFAECSFVGESEDSDDGDVPAQTFAEVWTKSSQCSLSHLALEKVGITGFSSILHTITSKQLTLTSLSLAFLEVKESVFAAMTQILAQDKNLHHLSLANCCCMGDTVAEHLAKALAKNTTLRALDISCTEINGGISEVGVLCIVDALEQNEDSALGDLYAVTYDGPLICPELQERLTACLQRNSELLHDPSVSSMPIDQRRN